VNFFGHAVVATWHAPEPRFVLGAMLPDFAAMIRVRPPEALDPELSRGIALHHATDRVFHDAPTFRDLGAWAFEELRARGLPRGPARAVAHVGVEILLDGVLAADAAARQAYLAALALGRGLGRAHVRWGRSADEQRFSELVTALDARGVSRAHGTPEVVAFRVERALAGRPRLALATSDGALVTAWAEHAAPVVSARAAQLIAEIRLGLAPPAGGC
jgi:acyl carrier protein phosphodiesterase